jgi:hypothetical protein
MGNSVAGMAAEAVVEAAPVMTSAKLINVSVYPIASVSSVVMMVVVAVAAIVPKTPV